MTNNWEIRCANCLSELGRLSEAPRLIVADPPYNQGVDYGDGTRADKLKPTAYIMWCRIWMTACAQALASDGSFWVICPDEWADAFAVFLKYDLRLHRRNWIKWYETFGVNCTRKFNRTSRHVLWYVKNPRQFVFNAEAVRTPSARQLVYGDKRANPQGKIMDDVWTIPRLCGTHKERLPEFPTQLPVELLERIVGCASDPGDLVMDPFSGSGTTGVAAIKLGRRYIGIEKSAHFAELSAERIARLSGERVLASHK